MTNSRDKGQRGERELAEVLRRHGIDARRGQQFRGGSGSPDVTGDHPFFSEYHVEVKRTQHLLNKSQLISAVQQAIRDSGGKVPVVAHRANGRDWLVTLPGAKSDFPEICKTLSVTTALAYVEETEGSSIWHFAGDYVCFTSRLDWFLLGRVGYPKEVTK